MFTEKYIELLLSGLVTRVALAFPVAYIRSISLFNNEDKIADCTWEDEATGTFTTYATPLFYTNSPQVVVEGMDAEGNPLHFRSPLDAL